MFRENCLVNVGSSKLYRFQICFGIYGLSLISSGIFCLSQTVGNRITHTHFDECLPFMPRALHFIIAIFLNPARWVSSRLVYREKKKARSSGKESQALALIQITVKCHVALEKNATNQRWTTYYCGCEGRLGMLDIILTFFAAMTWGSSPEIYIMHWLQANSMSTFHMAAQMHTSLSRRFPTSVRWC